MRRYLGVRKVRGRKEGQYIEGYFDELTFTIWQGALPDPLISAWRGECHIGISLTSV
jgi:hypothetical protein